MIKHKLLNKTKSATGTEPKIFHQLNQPLLKKKEADRIDGELVRVRRRRASRRHGLNWAWFRLLEFFHSFFVTSIFRRR
jgi:hypothetical protein